MRPTRVAPLAIFLREDAAWLLAAPQPSPEASLSHPAREVLAALESHGASFFADLTRATGRLASEVEDALWELVAAGLVTADGFENLRALLDPKRRARAGPGAQRAGRGTPPDAGPCCAAPAATPAGRRGNLRPPVAAALGRGVPRRWPRASR